MSGLPLVLDDSVRARAIADRLSDETDRARNAEPPIAEASAREFRAATLEAFVTAARALKAAEDALIAARQVYAEAVKRLSEEAIK